MPVAPHETAGPPLTTRRHARGTPRAHGKADASTTTAIAKITKEGGIQGHGADKKKRMDTTMYYDDNKFK